MSEMTDYRRKILALGPWGAQSPPPLAGQEKPSGPAQRLLDLIDRKGLSALG